MLTAHAARAVPTAPQHRDTHAATALITSILVVMGALCGYATLLPLPPFIDAVAIAALLAATGVGLSTVTPLPRYLYLPLTICLSATVLIVVSAGAMWLSVYRIDVVTTSIATITLGAGIVSIRNSDTERGLRLPATHRFLPRRLSHSTYVPAALIAASVAAWLTALNQYGRSADAGPFGLLAARGGPALCVALALAALVAIAGIRTASPCTVLAAAALAGVYLRVTATLVSEAPIYSWTYKHIGLVDYIQRVDSLPGPTVDIYRSWPGFFTANAYLSSATHIDPITVAHWFAPVTHLALAAAIYAVARSLQQTPLTAAAAVFISEVVNWVGQDYYSPQAVALVLAITVLGLVLTSNTHPLAGYVSLPLFAAAVCTHQLTPAWIIVAVAILTALRRVRPLWLVGAYVALFAAYVVPRLSVIAKYGVFTGSNPVNNAQSNIDSGGSPARTFTETIDRGLTVALWLLALSGGIYLWRTHQMWAPHAVLAFSSVVLLGGQSYGGEAIFRVFLYSVAGCAVMAAPVVTRALSASNVRRGAAASRSAAISAVLVAMIIAGAQGYFGGWSYVTIDKAQIEESRRLLRTSDPSAIITPIAPAGWAERPSADYVKMASVNAGYDKPLVFLKNALSRGFPTRQDVQTLNRVARLTGAQFYLVLPQQVARYNDYFGLFKNGAITRLEGLLSVEPGWRRVVNQPRLTIFQYDPPGRLSRTEGAP